MEIGKKEMTAKRPDGLLDKPQQVPCTFCGKFPHPNDSCDLSHVKLKGKSYERLKNEYEDSCGDCGVGADNYHHDGCDLETCHRQKLYPIFELYLLLSQLLSHIHEDIAIILF